MAHQAKTQAVKHTQPLSMTTDFTVTEIGPCAAGYAHVLLDSHGSHDLLAR